MLLFRSITSGWGLGFGTEIEQPCLSLKANKAINEQIDGSVSINIFLPHKIDFGSGDIKTSLFSINADGHYIFSTSDKAVIYGLAGLNISVISVKSDFTDPFFGTLNTSISDTNIGLNIGGGAELVLNDKLTGFGEAKYVLSSFDQLVIIVGVLLNVGG